MLTQYEENALHAINDWKSRSEGLLSKIFAPVGAALEAVPGVEKVTDLLVNFFSDVAFATVRPEAILEDFRKAGHKVENQADIRALPLEDVDRVVHGLREKYLGLAATEGALTGVTGLPGVLAGVPAVVSLAARCVAEYAFYYGFDLNEQRERIYAMQLMASATAAASKKAVILSTLNGVAREAAQGLTWKVLETQAVAQIIREVAQALGVNLTKRALGKVVPLLGAGVGATLDSLYLSDVCDSAENLYRERFLADQKGDPSIIQGE